jgi:CRISPR-associated protein Csb2
MPDFLCISIRFLDCAFHGRCDGGEPEWPPSPLRLFQALVAATAAHLNERRTLADGVPALQWLEGQPLPTIVAPEAVAGTKYRMYVPDNVGDLVGKSWSKHNDNDMSNYRTEKDVLPLNLVGGDCVSYLWPLAETDAGFAQHMDLLFAAVRSITHLGWGIDHVVADARVIAEAEAVSLDGERWHAVVDSGGVPLRAPIEGTLVDLMRKYAEFLGRVTPEGFKPVTPLSAFKIVNYRREGDAPPSACFAAFDILAPDASKKCHFDPVRGGKQVAAMTRHAAKEAAEKSLLGQAGWSEAVIAAKICGHGLPESEDKGGKHAPVEGGRIAFIPLPSLVRKSSDGSFNNVSSIIRVLLVGQRGLSKDDLQQIARLLPGQNLVDEKTGKSVAMLSRIPDDENMVGRYTATSDTWTTVTPMILPGYDDPKGLRKRLFPKDGDAATPLMADEQKRLLEQLDRRIDGLIRKAIVQAGFSQKLADDALIEWSNTGYLPGVDLAMRYAVPQELRRYRRLHVRITWTKGVDAEGNRKPLQVSGPLCIGGGRFVGMGLFVPA